MRRGLRLSHRRAHYRAFLGIADLTGTSRPRLRLQARETLRLIASAPLAHGGRRNREPPRHGSNAFPVPARETPATSSQLAPSSDQKSAGTMNLAKPGQPTAAISPLPVANVVPAKVAANPWRLGYVLSLAMATLMIGHFLLLAGGTRPTSE